MSQLALSLCVHPCVHIGVSHTDPACENGLVQLRAAMKRVRIYLSARELCSSILSVLNLIPSTIFKRSPLNHLEKLTMSIPPPPGTLDSWDANAEYWDKLMGMEGNKYWSLLELPCLKRLVPVAPGSKALDLCTGNGLVARWLASEGASVVATDGSENMLAMARKRAPPEQAREVTYQRLDVTRNSDFDSLLASESGVSHWTVYCEWLVRTC